MERDRALAAERGEGPDRELQEFKRKGEDDVVVFAMGKKARVEVAASTAAEAAASFKASAKAAANLAGGQDAGSKKRAQEPRKMSALEIIREVGCGAPALAHPKQHSS